MKICIMVDNLDQAAGWGRLAKNLRDALCACGHEVGFIARAGEVSGAETLHAPLRNVSLRKLGSFLDGVREIRRFARAYDVLLCFDLNPYGIISALALVGSPVKLVIYCLGSYSLPTQSRLRNFLMRMAIWRADQMLIVSEFLRVEVKKGGFDLSDAKILPVGVDPSFFYKTEERLVPIEGRYILGVGGIKYRKGFHLSLEAFARVAAQFPDITYIIVGRSDKEGYYERLTEQARTLGVAGRVRFLENLSDEELRSLYSYAECFILTPVTTGDALEGFGMVYLEAALCGLAAVGSKGSGAAEAINDGVSGLLAEPIPEKIAQSLERLLGNNDYRRELSTGAYEHARQYTWDKIAQRLDTILRTLS